MRDCLFCDILDNKIPAEKIYEDDEIQGFKDINPQAPVHVLFVPKKHIDTVNDHSREDIELMGKLIFRAKEYLNEIGQKNYRLVFNCGTEAGQTVFHVHLHCLAGRRFIWPPG